MAVVTTDEGRGDSRDVYVPAEERGMAHHSYLSPDGQWVLVVEMNGRGDIQQCRIVPFQGNGAIRMVGPSGGTCIAGAWSPDGNWVYLSVNDRWISHLAATLSGRRTGGSERRPTSQEGISMAPDGKSLITSVGSTDSTVWLHDSKGDHQISSEGNAVQPSFSSDGNSLYFLMTNGQTHGIELWSDDLASGKVERLLPGYIMESYSVSRDGKELVFAMKDPERQSQPMVRAHGSPLLAGAHLVNSPSKILRISWQMAILFSAQLKALEFSLSHESRWNRTQQNNPRTHLGCHCSIAGRLAGSLLISRSSDAEHAVGNNSVRGGWQRGCAVVFSFCTAQLGQFGESLFTSLYHRLEAAATVVPVAHDTGLPKLPPAGISRNSGPHLCEKSANSAFRAVGRKLLGVCLHPSKYSPQPISHPVALTDTPPVNV